MRFIFCFLFFIKVFSLSGQTYFSAAENRWVDSVYNALPDSLRYTQLFIIRAHSNLGDDHVAKVENLIKQYQVGGLCFFQGTPEKQAELTNRYQALANVPLLVTMDAEWGLNMRLKEAVTAYPKQMMLGAIQDNSLIYKFGAQVGKELRRIGVHVNYAPDADVNNNPNNPVINERSFGEDKRNVASKAFMYMRGMQDNGVMACAKHFPGHGDTDVDSHQDLPLISHDIKHLNDIELMPFRVLTQHGVGSVMVAHLEVPAIDATPNTPTTISRAAVTGLLRDKMGYQGLIFTDGLEMKGLSKYYPSGESSARCLAAGNDLLCLPEDIPAALIKIREFIRDGKINPKEIEASVKRVLHAKYKYVLDNGKLLPVTGKSSDTSSFTAYRLPVTIDTNFLRADLNSTDSKLLVRELVKNALTLVRNNDGLIPFKTYQPDSIVTLSLNSNGWSPFQWTLYNYGLNNQFNLPANFDAEKKRATLDYLSKKKIVIISLQDMKSNARDTFGLKQNTIDLVNELAQKTTVILAVFGNPYALKYFDGVQNVIECYNNEKVTQELAAEGLMGVFAFKGKLPVTASDKSKLGMGLTSVTLNRLEWNTDTPEAAGMDSKTLAKIDTIANELIKKHAAPGCQILIARNNQVVYHKAFGTLDYYLGHPVSIQTMYDLASITKCAATTVSLMKLYDEGKFSLTKSYGDYLPYAKGSNKEKMLMKDVLVHQAGLIPWIPFYKITIDSVAEPDNLLNPRKMIYFPALGKYYDKKSSVGFTVPVAKNLFLRDDYPDTIRMRIINSPLREKRDYVYSDLGMILMADVIKRITGKTLDNYANDNFYAPLGMTRTLFNPRTRFATDDCAPTDDDNYFRMKKTQAYVHDMGAAMLGGVSGHAGLFSTAGDLAVLCRMLLNNGNYGGVQYIQPSTVKLFTTRQEGSTRRGYGWDMKETDPKKTLNMSAKAPDSTFGHTGFTGNAFYMDPENQLIYIFLSNRTFPDMNSSVLGDGNYRPRIQSLIYEAMMK